jgi:tetratricopeptide (TPR) repeat protein
MTDFEVVEEQLRALQICAAGDVHTHFSPVMRHFRFVPRPQRRATSDEFFHWASDAPSLPPVKLAMALFLLGMDRFINEEHQASLQFLAKARTVFADCDDAEGLGLCGMMIGAIYRTLGNFDLGLKVLWEGYELLRASGRYPIFVAAASNSMANIHLDSGDHDEAMRMFTVTGEESARAGDFYFLVYALQGKARVHMLQERPAEAEAVFREALALAEEHRHPLHVSNSLTELAALHHRQGDLDTAQALSERALAIREEHRLLGGAVTSCLRLAEIHGERRRWLEALKVLRRALAIAHELDVKPKIAQVHLQMSQLYERMNDAEHALTHYKRYHALREEVEREDGAKRLADAKAIFEAEQTRKENATIKAQKAEIERKNQQLQDTIDELTRAKIGRKAKAMTLGLAVVLFVFQDAILGTALRLLASNNYFVLLAVKMAIIFSLSPINRGIERYLLRRVVRRRNGEPVVDYLATEIR